MTICWHGPSQWICGVYIYWSPRWRWNWYFFQLLRQVACTVPTQQCPLSITLWSEIKSVARRMCPKPNHSEINSYLSIFALDLNWGYPRGFFFCWTWSKNKYILIVHFVSALSPHCHPPWHFSPLGPRFCLPPQIPGFYLYRRLHHSWHHLPTCSHPRSPYRNGFYPLLPNSWIVVQSPSHIPPTRGSGEHVQVWALSDQEESWSMNKDTAKRHRYTYSQRVLTKVDCLRSVQTIFTTPCFALSDQTIQLSFPKWTTHATYP